MSITHAKVSAKSDGGDPTLVLPSDWNDDHVGSAVPDYPTEVLLFDDLYMTTTITNTNHLFAGGCFFQSSGTAAGGSAGISYLGHHGVVNITTGSTSSGRCAISSQLTRVSLGGGGVRFGVIFRPGFTSNGVNRYTIRAGIIDAITGDGSYGVFFRYTDNVNSGNWQAVCRDANVETGSVINSSVAATTNWVKLEYAINAAGTSVEFWIDGVSIGTTTTNIPVSGTPLMAHLPFGIVKSVGGIGSNNEVDAYWYHWTDLTRT